MMLECFDSESSIFRFRISCFKCLSSGYDEICKYFKYRTLVNENEHIEDEKKTFPIDIKNVSFFSNFKYWKFNVVLKIV